MICNIRSFSVSVSLILGAVIYYMRWYGLSLHHLLIIHYVPIDL